jgi:PAS domain-containing protein
LTKVFGSFWRVYEEATGREPPARVLQESEPMLASILDQLPVAVGVMNAKGRWVLSNQLMKRFIPQTVPSRDPARIGRWQSFDPDGKPIPPHMWPSPRALRGETVIPGMDFLYCEQVWTRVSCAPLQMVRGSVDYAMMVIEEIDEMESAGLQGLTNPVWAGGSLRAGMRADDWWSAG